MNPDIQRIAEPFTLEDIGGLIGLYWEGGNYVYGFLPSDHHTADQICRSLNTRYAELSALRDEQERELRGILSTGPEDERTLVEMVREERNLSEDLAERIDSLLRTIEDMKSGNAAHRRLCKQLNDRISWLESQREVECQQKIDAQKERDGFDSEVKSLRAELARRDEAEGELTNESIRRGIELIRLEEENASLRSRIGELEKKRV